MRNAFERSLLRDYQSRPNEIAPDALREVNSTGTPRHFNGNFEVEEPQQCRPQGKIGPANPKNEDWVTNTYFVPSEQGT